MSTLAGTHAARSTSSATPRPGRAPKKGARPAKNGGRRSTADLQGTVDTIVTVLKDVRQGMRSEQLQGALGLSKTEITRPLQLGLKNKLLKRKGQKRATTYFAA